MELRIRVFSTGLQFAMYGASYCNLYFRRGCNLHISCFCNIYDTRNHQYYTRNRDLSVTLGGGGVVRVVVSGGVVSCIFDRVQFAMYGASYCNLYFRRGAICNAS